MTPFEAWRFLAEAQQVMLRRSLALWAAPDQAAEALMRMAAEKQRAFAKGAAAAGRAAARGESAAAVMAAGMAPTRRTVRRNARRNDLG